MIIRPHTLEDRSWCDYFIFVLSLVAVSYYLFAFYFMIPWHCQTYTSKDIFPIYEPLDETMCIEISLPSRMKISIHKPFGSKHIDSLRLLPFYSPSSLCLYGWCMEWLQYDSIINLCNTNDKNMSMEAQFIILFFLLLPFFLCF